MAIWDYIPYESLAPTQAQEMNSEERCITVQEQLLDHPQRNVSVVIPVRNGVETIARCIRSVLLQDYPSRAYEVIVVDNESRDGTPSIVRQFPVRLEFENEIISAGAARNKGINAAKGEIVAFIDADCMATRSWLSRIVSRFNEADVGAVIGPIRSYEPSTLVEHFLTELNPYAISQTGSFRGLLTGNAACERDLLQDIGMFDEWLETAEDLDLGWRIQHSARRRIAYEPSAIVYHKHRDGVVSLFRQYQRYGLSEILVDSMLRGRSYAPRTIRQQLENMGKQSVSLLTYCLSFSKRALTWPITRQRRKEMLWPLFWLTVEGANVLGKMQGLWRTRLFSKPPSSRKRIG